MLPNQSRGHNPVCLRRCARGTVQNLIRSGPAPPPRPLGYKTQNLWATTPDTDVHTPRGLSVVQPQPPQAQENNQEQRLGCFSAAQ